jgi:hypothetical protein
MNSLLSPTNHLFNLARSGQRLPHIVLAVVLGFVFVFAALVVGGAPATVIVVALSVTGDIPFDNPVEFRRLAEPDTAL